MIFNKVNVPGGMLISSIYFSDFPTKESFQAKVGCVGIADTNAILDIVL